MYNWNIKSQNMVKDPCQMSNFNFDAPIKVSVLLEEMESAKLNASLDKKTNPVIETGTENRPTNPVQVENMDSRIVLKMIDSISYEIIDIWKYYHTVKLYMKIYNIRHELATASFMEHKYNCYNCSYSNFNNLILPFAHNRNVINNFIKHTALIASYVPLKIPHEFIAEIVDDMINWSKQHKMKLEPYAKNKQNMQTSAKDVDKICIFTHGSGDRKTTISVAPEVLRKHLQHSTIVEDTNNHKQTKRASGDQRSLLANNSSSNTNDDSYYFQTKRMRLTNTTLLPNVSNLSVPQKKLLNTVNDSETNNLLSDDANNQNSYTISRSISRDSNCVSLTDRPPSICSDQASTQVDANNNVIAQLTGCEDTTKSSFNKNISVAACSVCPLKTHKTCRGCNKVFYCSLECQIKNWPRHKKNCF